jgi:transforming growth factor-beta-induced protein
LITLPSVEIDEAFDKIAAEKPYLMLSPNDASVSAEVMDNIEGSLHKIGEAKNLVDLAASLNLTTLVKALEETGLDNIIDHEGHFTLFAPTNEAFENIPKWASQLPLKEVLRLHVARGLIYTKDIKNDLLVRSLLPKRDIRLNLYKDGKVITANGARVCPVDNKAHNGVLHIIDRVLVSLYEREGTIAKELPRCPIFKSLTKLLGVADLTDALNGAGPLTLFAPTDDAFAKLPADVVKHLVENPSILKQVLLYHVIGETWFAAGLEDGQTLTTLQKSTLSVSVKDGAVVVGGKATVTASDAVGSNGVIHSIDEVLLPPSIQKKLEKMMMTKSAKRTLKGINRD